MKLILLTSILSLLGAFTLAGCSTQTPEQFPQQAPHVIVANELAAMSRLRSIATAEIQYQLEAGGGYGSLDDLIEKGYLSDPSRGKLTGYRFEVRLKPGGYEATAAPIKFGITGRRSFYIDETRVMRGADRRGEQATSNDPEV
jgi:hypothetical protein